MSNGSTPARSQEQAPAELPRPQRKLTKAEVEEQLRRRRESMDGHLDGLQQELKTTGEEVQHEAQRTVQQNTLAVLGGMGLAGAVLGYWLVRRRKRRHAPHGWAEEYREAVREEVRAAVRHGEDPGEAASQILAGHRPLVVREQAASRGESRGILKTVADLVGRTLVSLAVKYAVDAVTEQYLPPQESREAEQTTDDAAPVAGAVYSQG